MSTPYHQQRNVDDVKEVGLSDNSCYGKQILDCNEMIVM